MAVIYVSLPLLYLRSFAGRLEVGSGRTGVVRRGEEVRDAAVLGQLAVLVVVEGLSGELAVEPRSMPGAG